MLSFKIKCFRSNGGGEYVNHKFKRLFHDCGIVHQIACPYTPEQNGCAERKHRHVEETGLTLNLGASMPLRYWANAFLATTYLINRMPKRSLHFNSPWQQLFGSLPNYMTLRVFGCACYPQLRPYSLNKLEPRTKQCVFIGYSLNYKGYRCLDLSTGRIYVSSCCFFMKLVFLLHQPHSPLLSLHHFQQRSGYQIVLAPFLLFLVWILPLISLFLISLLTHLHLFIRSLLVRCLLQNTINLHQLLVSTLIPIHSLHLPFPLTILFVLRHTPSLLLLLRTIINKLLLLPLFLFSQLILLPLTPHALKLLPLLPLIRW